MEALLLHKLEYLDTVCNFCMLWWVSTLIFSSSVISGIWVKQEDLFKISRLNFLCWFIFIFLCSVVIFGIWMVNGVFVLEIEAQSIAQSLGFASYPAFEFRLVGVAVALGTTSFVLFTLGWLYVWRLLMTRQKNYLDRVAREKADKIVSTI